MTIYSEGTSRRTILAYVAKHKSFYHGLNPITTNVPNHIETSQLICIANQLTGFYLMGTLVVKGLTKQNRKREI